MTGNKGLHGAYVVICEFVILLLMSRNLLYGIIAFVVYRVFHPIVRRFDPWPWK